VLYVGGLDRALHALRARDGLELWRFQTLGAVEGAPVVSGGVVYFGSDDGALYAVEAASGALRWRAATTAEVLRAPEVTADAVYFVNADDTVFAADRVRGTIRWRYRRPQPGGITGSGHAGLLRDGERVVTGFSDGAVVALDARDGAVRWEHDTSADVENVEEARESHRLIDVDSTPVLLGDTLYVASYTAGLYALDRETGSVRFRADALPGISGLATDGRDLYAAAGSRLLRVDPTDGTVRWSRELPSHGLVEPMLHGPLVLAPTSDGALWFLRARDGEALLGLGRDGYGSAPLIVGRRMYTVSNGAVVVAWRLLREG
jgi:outer membrane protein assembly factor BamB